ncbi:hypothetical protein KI387_024900, partial [Taxus chinensis]
SRLLNALNVKVVGTRRRILVLSHGFGTNQSIWQRILPHFVRDFQIVLFDLICAGSVNPDYFDFQRYGCVEAYAKDLITILDELGVEKCMFVGHSLSAMVGCMASIKRPSLFTKLVLFGASPSESSSGSIGTCQYPNNGDMDILKGGFRAVAYHRNAGMGHVSTGHGGPSVNENKENNNLSSTTKVASPLHTKQGMASYNQGRQGLSFATAVAKRDRFLKRSQKTLVLKIKEDLLQNVLKEEVNLSLLGLIFRFDKF